MFKLISFVSLLSVSISFAQSGRKFSFHSFPQARNFKIAVTDPKSNDMSKETFDKVLTHVERIYAPIVKKRGGILKLVRKWSDSTVNAYAQRQGNIYKVTMFGGLARHPEMTADGFALVVCHELGHHIGGSPKYPNNDWASSEGQSDYWGASKCAKRIFEKFDNRRTMNERLRKARSVLEKKGRRSANLIVNVKAKKRCDSVYSTTKDRALCLRNSMAGLSLARTLATLGRSPMPKFETPDKGRVQSTNHRHPAAQCRLDTYFQAALCSINANEEISSSDPFVGTCNRIDGDKVGIRPLCWFNPKDYK